VFSLKGEEIMKKVVVISFFLFVVTFFGLVTPDANAQSFLNEPGSILVFPLIDNINYQSIVQICNTAQVDVWLQGFMIVHPPGVVDEFVKKDFVIHLTQKEPFIWNTSIAYNRVDVDGIITQIPAFNNYKGFMFVWAIDGEKTRIEIDWDFLKGDVLLFSPLGSAFMYNGIPHQAIAIIGDRILQLDGAEYSMATSQVMVEGLAEELIPGLGGKFVVCSPEIDFKASIQPEFDINLEVWNQNEVYQSRHLHFYQFYQYDLTVDLQLHIDQIFTPKWWFNTTSTNAIWAIFFQYVGRTAWGCNVFQHPAAATPAQVILPDIPF
jgi:hypothetical protein